jgi:hypothetical protein
MAATCGVALAVSVPAQALAYGLAKGGGQGTVKVVAASPLTIVGTQASGWGDDGDSDSDSDSDSRILRGGSGRDVVPVTATISNPNTFHYWAHTVSASVLSTTKCTVTDFSVEGAPRQVNLPVVTNGRLVVQGISVRLAKKASGGCKNAKVTLAYSVS